jgi:hypothetical protein
MASKRTAKRSRATGLLQVQCSITVKSTSLLLHAAHYLARLIDTLFLVFWATIAAEIQLQDAVDEL